MRMTPSMGLPILAGAAAIGIALAAGGPREARAEESVFLSELSTPELLELTADIGEILRARGVLPDFVEPSDDYARRLAVRGLELTTDTGGLADKTGARYRVEGVRRVDREAPLHSGPLGDLGAAEFDYLLIVVFARDFQIERAALAPIEIVRAQAAATDATAEPTLALEPAFFETDGVADMTGQIILAATQG